MMYKTHKLIGENSYWLSLPLMFSTGMLVNPVDVYKNTGDFGSAAVATALTGTALYVGYKSCIFGAGYPDLDLANSEPSKKHKILGKVIRSFSTTHRNRYTHSLDSITLTFVLFAVLMCTIFPVVVKNHLMGALGFLGEEASFIIMSQFLKGGIFNSLIFTTTMFAMVGAWSHLLADIPGGIRIFFWQKNRIMKINGRFFRTGDSDDVTMENILRATSKILVPVSIIFSIFMVFFNINIFEVLFNNITKIMGQYRNVNINLK